MYKEQVCLSSPVDHRAKLTSKVCTCQKTHLTRLIRRLIRGICNSELCPFTKDCRGTKKSFSLFYFPNVDILSSFFDVLLTVHLSIFKY